jgi:hypothetical protein
VGGLVGLHACFCLFGRLAGRFVVCEREMNESFSFFSSLLFCSFSRTTKETSLFVIGIFPKFPARCWTATFELGCICLGRSFFAACAFVQGALAACANAAYAPQRLG